MKTTEQLIMSANNMVEITEIIMPDVFFQFANKFGKFNRENNFQQSYIDEVNSKYADEMKAERRRLFALIPDRFHKTNMYKKLEKRLK